MKEFEFALLSANIAALGYETDSSGLLTIAIHGWLDNAASFIPLMKSEPNFSITAVDLVGHGLSSHRPIGSHYHFIDWVSDLLDVIEQISPQQPVNLIGHSLGGMLATVVAGLYPERVRSLVLIDAAGLVIQDDDNVLTNMRQALNSRIDLRNKQKRIHSTIESAIRARVAVGDLNTELAELLVKRNTQKTSHGVEWRTDQRLKTGSPLRMNSAGARSIISNITCPVLLCLADGGLEFVQKAYKTFRSYYGTLNTINIPGGHHCHMENPKLLASAIEDFYRTLKDE